jgi:hypothetical protein
MGNLRQKYTDEEWDELTQKDPKKKNDIYQELAKINNMIEIGHNQWIDKYNQPYILTKKGFIQLSKM